MSSSSPSSPSSSSPRTTTTNPTPERQLAATPFQFHQYNNPAQTAHSQNLYHTTPLLHSLPLSRLCHPHSVYLKLDLLQPSGSFKDRGMAHLVCTVRDIYAYNNQDNHNNNSNNSNQVQFISSSGGNAGLALTTVCRSLRPPLPVSVIVPETTKPMVVRKLETLGADVTVFGKNWNEADALARKMVEEGKADKSQGTVYYVSPYDNPLLWTGHSTVVDEMIDQLSSLSSSSSGGDDGDKHTDDNIRIGAILASVGGGGLLSGILEGLESNYYHHHHNGRSEIIRGTKVVACETEGAASFAASFHANSLDSGNNANDDGDGNDNANEERSLNMKRLEGITSVATSLGALEVTPAVIHRAHRHQRRGRRCDGTSSGGDTGNKIENGKKATGSGEEDVLSYTCTDAEAVDACVRFATDHRMLVEPACGAALAPIYSERLRARLLEELDGDGERCAIVVEVCGGSGVSAELLMEWKKQFLE